MDLRCQNVLHQSAFAQVNLVKDYLLKQESYLGEKVRWIYRKISSLEAANCSSCAHTKVTLLDIITFGWDHEVVEDWTQFYILHSKAKQLVAKVNNRLCLIPRLMAKLLAWRLLNAIKDQLHSPLLLRANKKPLEAFVEELRQLNFFRSITGTNIVSDVENIMTKKDLYEFIDKQFVPLRDYERSEHLELCARLSSGIYDKDHREVFKEQNLELKFPIETHDEKNLKYELCVKEYSQIESLLTLSEQHTSGVDLYIAIRGSVIGKDFKKNFERDLYKEKTPSGIYYVHKAYYHRIARVIDGLKQTLREYLRSTPRGRFRHLTLTGHSQGGSLATVMALLLGNEFSSTIQVVGFAPLAVTLNHEIETSGIRFMNVVHKMDISNLFRAGFDHPRLTHELNLRIPISDGLNAEAHYMKHILDAILTLRISVFRMDDSLSIPVSVALPMTVTDLGISLFRSAFVRGRV